MKLDVAGCDLILRVEIMGVNVFCSGIASIILGESNDGLVISE